MISLLIFGGTIEGRELSEYLSKNGIAVNLSVATEFGKDMITEINSNLTIEIGRLNAEDITNKIQKSNYKYIIDATHPYAVEISDNIKLSCKETGAKYIRLLRKSCVYENAVIVNSIAEACIATEDGNVLATTGSKQIAEYTVLPNYSKRLYTRVLPTEQSIQQCINAGINKEQIITNLGASSKQENIEIIKKYHIKTLITKESGKKGGFQEKYQATMDTGIKLIVIERPTKEEGCSFNHIIKLIMEEK